MTAPERLDRAGFDALLQRHLVALAALSARPRRTDPNAPARKVVLDDAARVEAQARLFADAVDSSGLRDNGQPVPYESAVVLLGQDGPLVVRFADYDREPAYWQTRVGGLVGVVFGSELLGQLRAT